MNNLVVVESPAKSATIGRYLNNGRGSTQYRILATGGHIYEPSKVDVDDDFNLNYKLIANKAKAVNSIVDAMRTADRLYLATDPDREGEAISDHVYDHLNKKGVLKGKEVYRIVFHEITERAVLDAIANPGQISKNLVQAQQSRSALDWLVGFSLSPLLIRKLRTPHLSAGRVQSPALRLIVDRQREINRFEPIKFWTVAAELNRRDIDDPTAEISVTAQLTHTGGKKLKEHEIDSQEKVDQIVASIESDLQQSARRLTVDAIRKKKVSKQPPAPFKTSTFVQSATRRLRKSANDVSRIAQKLYEGLEVNGSVTGLITYTRTDSITLSTLATDQTRTFIAEKYGSSEMPKSARIYKTKSKAAQEAHEAIRPTDIHLTPDQVRSSLSGEQFAVYDLIWKRTVASQMNAAIYDQVSIDFSLADHRFRATGTTLRSAGWRQVYQADKDEDLDPEILHALPSFAEGEQVVVSQIKSEQHVTKPPPRYNPGSLVRQLEEYGIGRPSTWPTIITKLIDRNYVTVQQQRFYAQSLGCAVVDYLNEHFTLYVDYPFTGALEDQLDDIAQGELNRLEVLTEFWKKFSAQVEEKEKAPSFEVLLGDDPQSGRELLVRVRDGGFFLQRGRRTDETKPEFVQLPINTDPGTVTKETAAKMFEEIRFPRKLPEKTKDGREVVIKTGRYGPYMTLTDEDGKSANANLDENHDPSTLTIDDVEAILARPPLPRSLSLQEGDEFDTIAANRGRYGPYLTAVSKDGRKFNVTLTKEYSPYTVTREQALQIIKASSGKRGQGKSNKNIIKEFGEAGIQVLDGRYGPYVTNGKINATLPKSISASDVDLETCHELLEKKKQAGPKKRRAYRRAKSAVS